MQTPGPTSALRAAEESLGPPTIRRSAIRRLSSAVFFNVSLNFEFV